MSTLTRHLWQGHDLLAALRHAAAELQSRVDEVNALNVFPVPDGDTGSNMLATVRAAIDEAATVPEHARTLPLVLEAVSHGALMGARGNSGVILSQLFRGIAESLSDRQQMSGADLARAMQRGCAAAFAAVAQPVEGTMLTVARDVAAAQARAAALDGNVEDVLAAGVIEARASVERTPSLLDVLRAAGVVDAGGRGLELLLSGALAYARGEPLSVVAGAHEAARPAFEELPADEYGYETVFLVTPTDGAVLDMLEIRGRLEALGASVLVAGDERAVKVHIHNERPDEVIAYGLTLGTLSRISVENLDSQTSDVRRSRTAAVGGALNSVPVERPTGHGPAVVAVAPGDGFARVFEAAGAAAVVQGTQDANPSAGELAEAIHGTGRDQVIVLPNNPNVRLAARQAGQLCPDVEVTVVPTRNAAEGIAALLALDATADIKRNTRQMTIAAHGIKTMAVTAAVRDARIGRHRVRRGEHIVLGPDDGLLAAGADRTVAVLEAVRRLGSKFELITIYPGDGAPPADAEALSDALRGEFSGLETEVVAGGQPHYSFLISAE